MTLTWAQTQTQPTPRPKPRPSQNPNPPVVVVAGLAVVASRTTLPVAKQPCPRGAGHAVMAAGLPTWRPSMRWQEGPGSTALGSRSPLTPWQPHGPWATCPAQPSHLAAIRRGHLASWLLPHPSEHHIPTPQPSLSIRGSEAAAFQEEAAVLLPPPPNFLPASIFRKIPLPNTPPDMPGRNAFPAAGHQAAPQTLKYIYKVSLLYW